MLTDGEFDAEPPEKYRPMVMTRTVIIPILVMIFVSEFIYRPLYQTRGDNPSLHIMYMK